MKIHLSLIVATALAAAFATPHVALAAPNLLTNPGLELDAGTSLNGGNFAMITGSTGTSTALGSAWSITGSIDIVPSSYWQVTEGTYSVDLTGSPGLGSISQTLTGLSIGSSYTLTFDMTVNPANYIPFENTGIQTLGEAGTTKQLQVSVTNPGNSVIANQLYQGTVQLGASKTNMGYSLQTFQFTADATTETLTLASLLPLNIPTGESNLQIACGPIIDNLILTSDSGSGQQINVPEPASLGLLGTGALLLLRRRRNTR